MNPAPNVQPSPRLPEATLLTLVQALSGVQVRWELDVPAASFPGAVPGMEHAWIDMAISSIVPVGFTDERRLTYDSTTDQNDVVQIGQRKFTLNLTAKSLDRTLRPYDLCERVRFRLHTTDAEDIFTPARLSLFEVPPTQPLRNRSIDLGGGNKRAMMVASMDIVWNWAAVSDPLDANQGGYIAVVDGGGKIPITAT